MADKSFSGIFELLTRLLRLAHHGLCSGVRKRSSSSTRPSTLLNPCPAFAMSFNELARNAPAKNNEHPFSLTFHQNDFSRIHRVPSRQRGTGNHFFDRASHSKPNGGRFMHQIDVSDAVGSNAMPLRPERVQESLRELQATEHVPRLSLFSSHSLRDGVQTLKQNEGRPISPPTSYKPEPLSSSLNLNLNSSSAS